MRYDRDELLAQTDLGALADELLGWHAGHGRNARWPSPVPNHPQTGRTPPMSIFVDHRGIERWTCFATGANGTAIDLVTTATGRNVGDSIAWLAERVRLDRAPAERPPVVREPPPPPPAREPSAALRKYVAACERILWRPGGAAIRRWLVDDRCLDPDVLRHNRIGADPGPRTLRRARGLPWRGPAAVFPALDGDGEPVYLQARYLHPPPNRGKYDNPTAEHGTNPRLAPVRPVAAGIAGPTIVTEGVPDALAAATAGYRAAALLGAGLPDRRVAQRLVELGGVLVVAFDADDAGRAGAAKLRELLGSVGSASVVEVVPPATDLNAWLVAHGSASVTRQLRMSIGLARSAARQDRGRSIA
ncbi:MAG: toprim domain-containing protein [Acidimicrobiales bacterium]